MLEYRLIEFVQCWASCLLPVFMLIAMLTLALYLEYRYESNRRSHQDRKQIFPIMFHHFCDLTLSWYAAKKESPTALKQCSFCGGCFCLDVFCLLNRIPKVLKQPLNWHWRFPLKSPQSWVTSCTLECDLLCRPPIKYSILEDPPHENVWLKLLTLYFYEHKTLTVSPSPMLAQHCSFWTNHDNISHLEDDWPVHTKSPVPTHKHLSDPHCWALEPECLTQYHAKVLN